MAQKQNEEMKFEEALERLQDIVGKLEAGDVSLDESLKLFEEGVRLSSLCSGKLESVEKKIELLVEKSDGLSTEEFGNND